VRRLRTTARGALLSLIFGLSAAGASASEDLPDPQPSPPPATAKVTAAPAKTKTAPPGAGGVPQLIFPVVGPATYTDDFGDPRGNGRHEGNDIVAPKRALAVAAEAGRIELWTTSTRAGCMLYLHGASGTKYLYVHLNNDLTKGNDNTGKCAGGVAYTKGLKTGAEVAAGEPIGYVGDSGDADGIASHLHFEVHPKGGAAVSPYRYLRSARKLLFAAKPGARIDLTLSGKIVTAAGNGLTLAVERLRVRPTGLRIANVERSVELTVPPTAVVLDPLGALVAAAKLARARSGQPATVETEPVETTLQTQLGAPRALAAATIRLG
jgi:hypothetical protein